MTSGSQAVLLNAVPLLVLAAVSLVGAIAIVPALWRDRARARDTDYAVAAIFPCLGVAATIVGLDVLFERKAIGGRPVLSLVAIVVAAIPGLLVLVRWGERATVLRRAGPPAEPREAPQVEALATISNAFASAHDAESVARLLLDETAQVLGVDVTTLTLVDAAEQEGTGFLARDRGRDVDWYPDVVLDLVHEPSGISSAVFDAAPVAVFSVESSNRIDRRLAEAFDAKSAAYVPLIADGRVIAVLVAVAARERRAFTRHELSLMQTLAAEAALALERTRSAAALGEALDRERLVAGIARRLRAELDLDEAMRVAVEEAGRALGASRCFLRLGATASAPGAEWSAPGFAPIGQRAALMPVATLAARERRTVAIDDVDEAPELEDPALGSRDLLRELGTAAALATPVVVFDEPMGVLGFHRPDAHAWPAAEIALAEAVARELGLALHTARLLGENERRIEQQTALLRAAQALASELRLDTVLQRLVDQVAELLGVDAADCYLYDGDRRMLRCAAVHGMPPELVGWEFRADRGAAAEAIAQGKSVVAAAYDELADPVPHPAYAGFAHALVAPMTGPDGTRGVLGLGRRRGGVPFEEADAEVLDAFASLASLALQNAQAFEERSRQARVQRGFYRIASILGQPLSLAATLDAIAQAAAEALGGSFAAVLMPRARGLELAGGYELPAKVAAALATGLPESAGALRAAALDRRILAAPAIAVDERFEADWTDLAGPGGCSSLIAVPVESPRQSSGGLVVVFFGEPREFADVDLDLARHLADATRGALERSELFEAERTSRALAQQLSRTGSLLATELDPAAVLDEVVQQAPALLGADACTIRVLEGDELVVSAAEGEGVEAAVGTRSSSTAWLSGDVVQSRAPVAIEQVGGDARMIAADIMLEAGYEAYLGVPLVGPEGSLHGVLAVYAKRPRTWLQEEIDALLALAGNTSAALSNAELYQRVALEKERSFAILANIADGIVAVDRDGKVVLWNAAAEQITGVPAEEALGRTPLQVLQRNLESYGDAPLGDRLVSIPRGSDEVWLSLTEAVMRDPAGAVAGRIFAFRDISADRFVEQMKSDFVSTVSHELRTPLTSIYGFAETLLRRDVQFGEAEREMFLGYIASEAERLTAIVDALLNVARLDTGDLQVNIGEVDVASVVSEVVTTAQSAPSNGHDFVVDLPSEPLAAEADPDKLRQIVAQLVDNAVKYSPAGGTVTVAARRKSDTVEVSVADQGIGIPRAEQRRIFRKFYRAEASARDAGAASPGTGLGLFIAEGLVTAMGGRIWVDSDEGKGSNFGFELPIAKPA